MHICNTKARARVGQRREKGGRRLRLEDVYHVLTYAASPPNVNDGCELGGIINSPSSVTVRLSVIVAPVFSTTALQTTRGTACSARHASALPTLANPGGALCRSVSSPTNVGGWVCVNVDRMSMLGSVEEEEEVRVSRTGTVLPRRYDSYVVN